MLSPRYSKIIKSFCVTLLILSFSGMLFAETIAQKTIRLRREKEAGVQSDYQRNTEYTSAQTDNTAATTTQTSPEPTGNQAEPIDTPPKPAAPAPAVIITTTPTVIAEKQQKIAYQPGPLDIVPADALVCIRINNLTNSLSALDDYLIGLSPMPVGMMATAQIGNMIGNPMLTGVDMSGDFIIFGKFALGTPVPSVVVMLPVTDYIQFISSYPTISAPDADGISTITIANSPVGNLVTTVSPDGKHAIVAQEINRQAITSMLNSLSKESSLAYSLDGPEHERSSKNPVWVYGNVEKAVEMFSPMITGAFQEIQQTIKSMPQDNPSMPNQQFMDLYFNSIISSINQIKSVSVTLRPTSDKLSISIAVAAKPGSKIANALVADDSSNNSFTLAGYLDQTAAMNATGKVNKQLTQNLSDLFLENFTSMKDDFAEIKKLIDLTNDAMGDEVAFSMSVSDGPFPFVMKQLIRINKTEDIDLLIQQNFQANIEMVKLMGPADADYDSYIDSATSLDYKNTAIHSMKLPVSTMPEMTLDMSDLSLDTNIAIIDDVMILTMGPNSLDEMYVLIDRIQSGEQPEISGDMAMAMGLIDNPQETDFIASYNYIRLMTAMSKMMQSAAFSGASAEEQAQMEMAAGMFSSFDIPTESCMAIAGKVDNARFTAQIVLPKQHLMEIVTAVNQMQQQMMQQMQQMQMQQIDQMDPEM